MWKVNENSKVPSILKEIVRFIVDDLNFDKVSGDWDDGVLDAIQDHVDDLQRHPGFDRIIDQVGFTKAYEIVTKTDEWKDMPADTPWAFMFDLVIEAFTQCAYYE